MAQISGYGMMGRIFEETWEVKKAGMKMYGEWKDAGSEGSRVQGEFIKEGRQLAERAEAMLRGEVGGGEGKTVRRRRTGEETGAKVGDRKDMQNCG